MIYLKIAIVSGGTGGHIFPALDLAKKLKEKHNVVFIGSNQRMEAKIVASTDIPFKGFDLKNKKLKLFKNILICKKYLKEEHFDLAIGFGNYISVSFLIACYLSKVKFIIHEQNIIPGKANKLLHRFSDKTIISFEETKKYLKGKKVLCLGNPREERKYFETSKNKTKSVLVVMGSLGSSTINKLFETMFNSYNFDCNFTIVTGKSGNLKINNNKVKVVPFIDNLPIEATKYDLVITRAGATTLKELASFKVPMLIIPSPYVANNHQYFNAKYYQDNNAAIMLEEKGLNAEKLYLKIKETLNNSSLLVNMSINAYKLSYPFALTHFVKEVEKYVG